MPRLKWGNQRVLNCINISTHQPSSLHHRSKNQTENPFNNSKKRKPLLSNDIDDNLNNINAVREKLMIDLRVAANNLKVSIFDESVTADDSAAVNPMPWNLRTRRAACKASNREEQRNLNFPVNVIEAVVSKEKKNKKNVERVEKNQKMVINGRREFCVSITKEEIEQDYWALVGTKPPRRPKKRPKVVQRQLDTLFPGLWLTEVNADSYKVSDDPK
ncbi:hypothetical protein TanjilG_32804 [Lupinus angustifolius]|uniref:DUF1639 family protein n=2 Tax=Lupinus angustifolius TaxID=3871 RepID=A0A4P1RG51_LUPAN|nr:hypothetical protein TanjilG_32804 [Lupinus angustifolius]